MSPIEPVWIVVDSSPGPVTVGIGRRNPALDRLLERNGAATCAYLSGRVPDHIAHELCAAGCRALDAHAVSDDAYAPIEDGALWIGVPQPVAESVAGKLGRDTLVWHEHGRPTQFVPIGARDALRRAVDTGA